MLHSGACKNLGTWSSASGYVYIPIGGQAAFSSQISPAGNSAYAYWVYFYPDWWTLPSVAGLAGDPGNSPSGSNQPGSWVYYATKVEVTAYAPGTQSSPGNLLSRPTGSQEPYMAILNENTDNDDQRPEPAVDNDDETPGALDNDLVKMTLKLIPSGLRAGTVYLTLPEGIRVFDSTGAALASSDLAVNLASPQGKLAGIRDGPVDVYLEGLSSGSYAGQIISLDFSGEYTWATDGVTLILFDLTPNPTPLNGVVRARIIIGHDKNNVPVLDENGMPMIKIGDQACTEIRQDEYDSRIFYFTPPSSPTEQEGKFDLEVSGITVDGIPFLLAGQPLVLGKFAEYTNDAEMGVKKFSEAIGVSISEAESMAKKKKEDNGLSAEEAAEFFSSQLDYQSNQGMELMKTFMDGKIFTSSVETAFQDMEDENGSRSYQVINGLGFNPDNSGDGASSMIVEIVATDVQATETGDPGSLAFTRTSNFNVPLTIYFTVEGTATDGIDYAAIGNSITIPAYEASKVLQINPIADSISEGSETVQITISPDQSYQVGNSNSAQATIYE